MGTSHFKSTKSTMSSINVVLMEMNGRQYQLEVEIGATVFELKQLAHPVLLVPVQFQVFIIDAAVLEDDEPVGSYVQDFDKPLMVTFYFSDGGVLDHESVAARVAAIEALTKVAHGGRRPIIDIFISFSREDNEICRQAAVAALAEVAHLADEHFLNALVARLLDSNKLIAVTAVQALAKAVESGNEEARPILLEFVECIEDQDDVMLQLAVIDACLKLPQKHGRRVIRSLFSIFSSSMHNRVRCTAKKTAAEIARRARGRAGSYETPPAKPLMPGHHASMQQGYDECQPPKADVNSEFTNYQEESLAEPDSGLRTPDSQEAAEPAEPCNPMPNPFPVPTQVVGPNQATWRRLASVAAVFAVVLARSVHTDSGWNSK